MTAKLEQLIVAEFTVGKGTEHNPVRNATRIFRPDGTLVTEHDEWRREKDEEVMQWAKQLCGMIRRQQAAGDVPTKDTSEDLEAAISLIEKYAP